MEIFNFNIVDASNNAADQFPENMQYSAVNDNARGVMGAIARWYADTNGSLVSTGSSGAYALTTNQTGITLSNGLTLAFRANHTGSSTGATLTVTPSGGSALTTKNILGSDGNQIVGEALSQNSQYIVVYNTTADGFVLIGAGQGTMKLIETDVLSIDSGNGPAIFLDPTPGTNSPDIQMKAGGSASDDMATVAQSVNLIQVTGGSLTLSKFMSGTWLDVSNSASVTFDSTVASQETGRGLIYYVTFQAGVLTLTMSYPSGMSGPATVVGTAVDDTKVLLVRGSAGARVLKVINISP